MNCVRSKDAHKQLARTSLIGYIVCVSQSGALNCVLFGCFIIVSKPIENVPDIAEEICVTLIVATMM